VKAGAVGDQRSDILSTRPDLSIDDQQAGSAVTQSEGQQECLEPHWNYLLLPSFPGTYSDGDNREAPIPVLAERVRRPGLPLDWAEARMKLPVRGASANEVPGKYLKLSILVRGVGW